MPSILNALTIYIILLTAPGLVFASTLKTPSAPIVVTIKPLYSLVAQLSAGIEKPVLLMKQMQSPHHYNMRPSERQLLANARMIIWIGPQMESFLSKVIQQHDVAIVSAMQADDLKLLDRRTKNHHHHGVGNLDPHIWLSAHNAIAISKHINQQLIHNNPEHAEKYKKNLQQLIKKITLLAAKTKNLLSNKQQAFITYHDAFQYFEDENRLNQLASVVFDEESSVSIKHLQHIKSVIEKNNIQCLLY